MNNTTVLKRIGLAVLRDKKILMVRHRGSAVFDFVGGEPGDQETDIACLARKAPGEIGVSLDIESLQFLGEFTETADEHERTNVNFRFYEGKVFGEPSPMNKVEELRYFDSSDDTSVLSAIAVNTVFPWLVTHGYIH